MKLTKDQTIKAEAILYSAFALYFWYGTELNFWLNYSFAVLFTIGAGLHYYWWFKK